MEKSLIGLLSGGLSGERYLSLRSREHILKTLLPSGKYRIFPIDWIEEKRWLQYDTADPEKAVAEFSSLPELLANSRPDCLFNAFHGEREIDGRITGLLDLCGIPYVGNGFYTCFTGIDKILSKLIFEKEGIPTPPWFTLEKEEADRLKAGTADLPLPFPLIVKPRASGSSIGIRVAENRAEFFAVLEETDRSHFPVLAESFLKGRECNVGIAGPFGNSELLVTPITEVVYPGKFFDETCKKEGSYKVRPIDLPRELNLKILEAAKKIHSAFRAAALTRSDFIVDPERGTFTVLEINTHPGLSGCSIFPAQVEKGVMPFKEFLEKIIDERLRKA